MSEKFSDVIIVGTDLAGLITGAFLAKRGLVVTVLNFEKDVLLEKKNIQPNLITHLESKLFKSILGRLSILDHELQIIRKLAIPYQVVMPKHRIDIYRDADKFHRELRREFAGDFESLRTFYDSMDHVEATLDTELLQDLILPKGLRKRWKFYQFVKEMNLSERVSEYIDSLSSDREVRCFLDAQLRLLSKTHSENPFTYQIAKTLSNDNCMLFDVQGGIGHLKKLFLDKIEAYAGKVKNEIQLESFQIEKRQIKAVNLGGFEGTIGCRYLLWNDEIRSLLPFLPKKLITHRLIKKIQSIVPKYYHFSIQYRIDPGVIPVGMHENLLLVTDPNAELKGTNYLHLNLYRPAQENTEGETLLTVSYLLAAERLNEPAAFFHELHEQITKQLFKLMPFSETRIALSFPLDDKISSSDGTLFALEKGDFEIFRENASANPIYTIAAKRFNDLFPLGNRTPFKNLFLTSPEILAALSFEGKFLLGLKTVDLIWKEAEGTQKRALRQRKIA